MDIFKKIQELREKHEKAQTENLRKLYETMIKILVEELNKKYK